MIWLHLVIFCPAFWRVSLISSSLHSPMLASSASQHQHQVAYETGESKRRERPPALHIPLSHNLSGGDACFQRNGGNGNYVVQQVRRAVFSPHCLLIPRRLHGLAFIFPMQRKLPLSQNVPPHVLNLQPLLWILITLDFSRLRIHQCLHSRAPATSARHQKYIRSTIPPLPLKIPRPLTGEALLVLASSLPHVG